MRPALIQQSSGLRRLYHQRLADHRHVALVERRCHHRRQQRRLGDHLDRLQRQRLQCASITNPNGEVAPTYVTNVYNGKPVVRFAGDNLLQVSALPLGTYTIATVFKTTGNSQIVYEHSDNLLSNSNGNFLFTSTQSTISVKRDGAQTGKDILGSGAGTWAANCSTPILTVDEFGGTDASEALYINGAQQQLVENWTGNLNNTTAYTEPFNIGERAS